jgi:fatty-acyl-CoA synthase
LNKVGVKVLVMAESFKKSTYVDIIRDTVPELKTAKKGHNTINSEKFPLLKNVVVLSDT